MKEKKNLSFLTTCALMAAVMCALAPMSLPIGPIPVSLGTFVLYLSITLLGMKGAAISCLVYLLLGAVGLPVFSGFQGGLAKLVGPTGGYLIGYIPLVLVAGWIMEKYNGKIGITILGMVAGTAVLYILGTAWFVGMMKCEIWYALTVCVFPFIPVDLGKMIAAVLLGKAINVGLTRAGLK